MAWTRMTMNNSEHWVLRECNAPICALHIGDAINKWQASMLTLCGKSTVVMHTTAKSLEQAQRLCEKELRLMGWKWGTGE